MDATKTGAAKASINTFEPLSDTVREGDCDTLLVYLPGFVREELRVQLGRSGVLKISGTRPLGDNKWSSFMKDFPISPNCDTSKITAKFEEGILYVRQPKVIVPAQEEETWPAPVEDPSPPAATTADDNNRETAAADKFTPPVDHKEASHEERSNEPFEDALDNEEKHNALEKDALDGKIRQPSAELREARQKMTVVLVALVAFVLGMLIKSLLAWFSRPADE